MTKEVNLKIFIDDKTPKEFYEWLEDMLHSNRYIKGYESSSDSKFWLSKRKKEV